jgi:chromosome segregation ATPase
MDLAQLAKQVDWLDGERRKDKQEITALYERLAVLVNENSALTKRLQQLETQLTGTGAQIQRLTKVDEVLEQYRREMARQVEEMEKRRQEAQREDERLRKIERDGLNKSLGEVRKGLESVTKIERDLDARREEEGRISRLVSELQKKVTDFNKLVDERNRSITLVEEGRRTDAKRITDVQADLSEMRRRQDEGRGKIDVVEDIARRAEARIAEVINAESERRATQVQWTEAQSIRQAEQERAFVELKAKVEASLEGMEDYARKVNQYAETNREFNRASADLKQAADVLERRINEVSEIQRLAEDRLRQDWNAFLADDQKRWTTHMLLRDEQWREHDRAYEKQITRVETLEEQAAEVQDVIQHMRELDANRLQTLLNVIREMVAEYDQQFVKVK